MKRISMARGCYAYFLQCLTNALKNQYFKAIKLCNIYKKEKIVKNLIYAKWLYFAIKMWFNISRSDKKLH